MIQKLDSFLNSCSDIWDSVNRTSEEIIKAFQTKIGAIPDGLIGKETYRKGMQYFGLTPESAAHFFGQIRYETSNFKFFEENLNYSGLGLMVVFPKYFPTKEKAELYARQPERIANLVYANRMGNGSESSGDGWKYRGRGAIQLTGRNNYRAFAEFFGRPVIEKKPDEVRNDYAFEVAHWYFLANNLFTLASRGVNDDTIELITRKINGGTHGLESRKQKTYEVYSLLKN